MDDSDVRGTWRWSNGQAASWVRYVSSQLTGSVLESVRASSVDRKRLGFGRICRTNSCTYEDSFNKHVETLWNCFRWRVYEPTYASEECAVVLYENSMHVMLDIPCQSQYPFICQISSGKSLGRHTNLILTY